MKEIRVTIQTCVNRRVLPWRKTTLSNQQWDLTLVCHLHRYSYEFCKVRWGHRALGDKVSWTDFGRHKGKLGGQNTQIWSKGNPIFVTNNLWNIKVLFCFSEIPMRDLLCCWGTWTLDYAVCFDELCLSVSVYLSIFQNTGFHGLFNVLSSRPVLNKVWISHTVRLYLFI